MSRYLKRPEQKVVRMNVSVPPDVATRMRSPEFAGVVWSQVASEAFRAVIEGRSSALLVGELAQALLEARRVLERVKELVKEDPPAASG